MISRWYPWETRKLLIYEFDVGRSFRIFILGFVYKVLLMTKLQPVDKYPKTQHNVDVVGGGELLSASSFENKSLNKDFPTILSMT